MEQEYIDLCVRTWWQVFLWSMLDCDQKSFGNYSVCKWNATGQCGLNVIVLNCYVTVMQQVVCQLLRWTHTSQDWRETDCTTAHCMAIYIPCTDGQLNPQCSRHTYHCFIPLPTLGTVLFISHTTADRRFSWPRPQHKLAICSRLCKSKQWMCDLADIKYDSLPLNVMIGPL